MNMFYNICSIINAKNGNENIKIYCIVKCGGNGLVMTKTCEILNVLMLI